MKMMTLAAIGVLTFAVPAFAQMQPAGPADGGHGGHGGARGPAGSQSMDEHRGGDMNRGHGDGAMSGREDGVDHRQMGDDRGRDVDRAGYDRGMDRGRGDHDRGYGRHCRTVWHHHHKVRRCD